MNEDHLDPEIVAAWADGSLDPSARAAAEAHAADCLRCQAVLAAMVRTEPVVAAARPAWFRAPLRWAIPLAAGAAALALWIAVPRESSAPAPVEVASRSNESARTLADQVAPPPAATPQVIAPSAQPKRPTEPVMNEERARDARASARSEPPPVQSPPQEKPQAVGETAGGRLDELRRDPLAGRSAAPAATPAAASAPPAPAAQPPPPPPQQQQQQQAQPRTEQVAVTSETVVQSARQATGAFSADTAGFRGVASPDPAIRYRVGAKGLIQRSTDTGRTWVTQASGVQVALTAASAPSATVCWVVGHSGVVLRSTDGTTWRRLPFPDHRDLRHVTASDANTASVTTADGRVFRTTDGGAGWRREEP